MSTEEASFLLLMPYRSHREISRFPDSRVVKANCGHFTWLSPQGERHFEIAYTCCMDCGEEILYEDSSVKATVPGAMDAVRATAGDVGVEVARSIMRQLGIEEL